MKRTFIYLIILILLGGVAYFLLGKDNGHNEGDWQNEFAVEDTASITKIFLADKAGNEVLLLRQNGHWTINGKYIAFQPKVNNLLQTIHDVKSAYPVPFAGQDNVVRQMASTGIKVEIYMDDNTPAKTYYVGGSTADSKGTFMLASKDGKMAERPYVTHIPGWVGFLTPRYFTNAQEWRDLTVFDYAMNEINRVKIEYPNNPQYSFQIESTGNEYTVTPLDEAYKKTGSVFQQGVVKYLSSFVNKNAEALENDYVKKDSILSTPPRAIIEVETKDGELNKVIVFTMPLTKRSKGNFDESGNPLDYDIDRYFALVNNGEDFVIIQHFVFGEIFRRYDDFIQNDVQPVS